MAALTLRVTPGVPVACSPDAAYVLAIHAEHEEYLGRFNPRIVYVDDFDELDAAIDKFSVYLPQGESIRYYDEVFHPAYADDHGSASERSDLVRRVQRTTRHLGVDAVSQHLRRREP